MKKSQTLTQKKIKIIVKTNQTSIDDNSSRRRDMKSESQVVTQSWVCSKEKRTKLFWSKLRGEEYTSI